METERTKREMSIGGSRTFVWSNSGIEVVFWAFCLSAVGLMLGLDGWAFGAVSALLALNFNRLAESPLRSALFVLYGALSLALALWIPAIAAWALAGLASGAISRWSDNRHGSGRYGILEGVSAGAIGTLLLIREHTWVYQPVQLAAAIFCVLLLILTRNRLLSVALSTGFVLLAALHGAG